MRVGQFVWTFKVGYRVIENRKLKADANLGLLSYMLGPKWTLSAGYRYLFVDYGTRTALYNTVTAGAVLGAAYRFK